MFASVCKCTNCSCQWGLSGILLGVVILLAACVFTFFPAFLDIFAWEWYEDLCKLWFGIGGVILALGCLYTCRFGCDAYPTWDEAKKQYNVHYGFGKAEAGVKEALGNAQDKFAAAEKDFEQWAKVKETCADQLKQLETTHQNKAEGKAEPKDLDSAKGALTTAAKDKLGLNDDAVKKLSAVLNAHIAVLDARVANRKWNEVIKVKLEKNPDPDVKDVQAKEVDVERACRDGEVAIPTPYVMLAA